jgi:hypothetical protein
MARKIFRGLLSVPLMALLLIPAGERAATADAIDQLLNTPNNSAASLVPACKGFPIATQNKALLLIKSDVCSDLAQVLNGTQSGSQIGSDFQAIYVDLQSNFSLTPICAGSLMAVFAQRLITGRVSAGLCPAGS